MRTLRPLEQFFKDIRFGARLLFRSPLFTIVAVLSLALGIGANSAIFSLINGIVLRTLPIADAEQLYIMSATREEGPLQRFSYPVVASARELLAGRAELCAQSSDMNAQVATRGPAGASRAEAGMVQLITGECFGLLRQRAQLGRLLGPDDNRTIGQHPVAVISDGYWTRRFGRAPAALGSDLIVNGAPLTIVGIAMPEFFGTSVDTRTPDIWAPVMMQAAIRFAGNMSVVNGDPSKPWPAQREVLWLQVLLRIAKADAPAVTDALHLTYQRESALMSGYNEDQEMRDHLKATQVSLTSGSRGFSRMRETLTTPLIALLVMVGLLLTIACANLASLLLARAASRHREMAIRLSIGAGRGRLIRQLLTESLLLALIGGALGLLFAHWGIIALLTLMSEGIPVTGVDVRPDWRVIAVTAGIAIVTGLLFGLLPALRSTRVALAETLKSQTRSVIGDGDGRRRAPIGKLLIAGQLALSLLLLIVAALFTRSLQELTRVDVGFDRDRVLVARLDPSGGGYTKTELPDLYRRVIDRVGAIPGVTGVSLSSHGPFSGSQSSSGIEAEGYARGREQLRTGEDRVTPDYFRTVGLRIVRGRGFLPEDTAKGRKVSVINETMAGRYFRGRDPIGLHWGYGTTFDENSFEIVGVVEDARYNNVKREEVPLNMAYKPAAQGDDFLYSLEVRTAGAPAALAPTVRRVLQEAEPRLPVRRIETLDDRVARSMSQERALAWLTIAFGIVALSLACLGLYGTISYAVTRRTAELGVRMALGAGRGAVQWLILREALTLVLLGLLVGLPLAFLAARAMNRLLFGIAPSDLAAYAGAVGALVCIAVLAAWLPARRASRVDPMVALRAD